MQMNADETCGASSWGVKFYGHMDARYAHMHIYLESRDERQYSANCKLPKHGSEISCTNLTKRDCTASGSDER